MPDIETIIRNTEKSFSNCADFAKRIFIMDNNERVTVLYLINLCDKSYITESVLKPMTFTKKLPENKNSVYGMLASLPLSEFSDSSTAIQKILSGNALIIGKCQDGAFCFAADAKSENGRSISEPESESVVRGPRQGFVENAMVNLTMLRKIIKSEKLKVINMTFGQNTSTDVKIIYHDDIVRKDVLAQLLNRLSEIKIDSCVDSGYIEMMLQNSKYSIFTSVGNSEKPDKVASKILGGRIAIICDGSPVVLTVPYLFAESIQSAEDYMKNIFYATFIRCLRMFSMLITIYLPAVYIAIHEFHKGALPYSLYKNQMQNRASIPFDIFTEMFTVLIIFEIIREVGVRMPKAVGDALSVVGGLILGDAAIKAGITSETVIVIAALTGICNFMNPTYMNSNVLLRFINLIAAKILGFFGISVCFMITLAILCSKTSFGVPYMSPLAPLNSDVLTDTVIIKPYAAAKNHSGEISDSDN